MGAIWDRIKAFLVSLTGVGWFVLWLSGKISFLRAVMRDFPLIGWIYDLVYGMPGETEEKDESSSFGAIKVSDGENNATIRIQKNSKTAPIKEGDLKDGRVVLENLTKSGGSFSFKARVSRGRVVINNERTLRSLREAAGISTSRSSTENNNSSNNEGQNMSGDRRQNEGTSNRNPRNSAAAKKNTLQKTTSSGKGFLSKVASLFVNLIGFLMNGKLIVGLIGFGVLSFVFVGVASGTGYGMLISDTVGDPIDGALGDTFDEMGYQVDRLVKTASCMGDAGCVRELQQNTSSDLGSEDVGETYEVSMEGPELTGTTDVSVRNKYDRIPVYFGLKNSRHGTRGVDAKDVQYRVEVSNPGAPFVSDGDISVCETGWKPISKYPNAEDLDSERDSTLYPGQKFDFQDESQEKINLYDCGLINPGALGNSHMAKVDVKYDYSTFSILELEAMARENHQGVREDRKSRSVDTPARTAITTSTAPITYRKIDGRENPISDAITLRIWLETEKRGTRFKVDEENFMLKDSSLTERVKGQCEGLKKVEEDTYKLSDSIQSKIRNRQKRENNDWFSSRTKTPTATCDFKLSNPKEVSETGESVSFRARANYTVRFEEESSSFTLQNGDCQLDNCPYIKPLKSSKLSANLVNKVDLERYDPLDYKQPNINNWNSETYWKKEYAKCNRPVDSKSSCSWVESFNIGERDGKTTYNGEYIELGEFALKLDGEAAEGTNFFTCNAKKNLNGDVISVEPENLEKAFNKKEDSFHYKEGVWGFVEDINPATQECGD